MGFGLRQGFLNWFKEAVDSTFALLLLETHGVCETERVVGHAALMTEPVISDQGAPDRRMEDIYRRTMTPQSSVFIEFSSNMSLLIRG